MCFFSSRTQNTRCGQNGTEIGGATPVPAGTDADCAAIGDDELLEADDARHVLLQGGELQGRSQTAIELYAGVPGGRLTTQ